MQMPETDPYLSLSPAEIASLEQQCLFPTYKRADLYVSHGAGAYVFDLAGRRYLDIRNCRVRFHDGCQVVRNGKRIGSGRSGQLQGKTGGIIPMLRVLRSLKGYLRQGYRR